MVGVAKRRRAASIAATVMPGADGLTPEERNIELDGMMENMADLLAHLRLPGTNYVERPSPPRTRAGDLEQPTIVLRKEIKPHQSRMHPESTSTISQNMSLCNRKRLRL